MTCSDPRRSHKSAQLYPVAVLASRTSISSMTSRDRNMVTTREDWEVEEVARSLRSSGDAT